MNIIKSIGELGSPCLTPICELIYSENRPLYLTQFLATKYIDFSALTILLLTFSRISLCHNVIRSILSNAFSKSIKIQYSFCFESRTFEIIDCKMKIQSVVDFPFWNPNWFLDKLSYFSAHVLSRFSKICE